jgi:hypothetical protein
MTDPRIDEELAEAILAAITEARENGIPEERIIEMLAESLGICAKAYRRDLASSNPTGPPR